jgi:hypothetical protein
VKDHNNEEKGTFEEQDQHPTYIPMGAFDILCCCRENGQAQRSCSKVKVLNRDFGSLTALGVL